MDTRSRSEIVLIGPHRAGKSTIAALLAARLDAPVCSLDRIKWRYFGAMGLSEDEGRRMVAREGFHALTLHLKPYAIEMVEQVLAEHQRCVFDFGAGHSMYEEPGHVARIQAALAPFRHVVLVLPVPDPDESVRILRERAGPWIPDGSPYFDFETYEVRHPLNRLLATHTVYTHGRTPDDACDEVMGDARVANSES
jgi:shikimate kinase